MTGGHVIALVGAVVAVVGLTTAIIGQVQRDGYTMAGGACCILFGLVWVLLSFRDFR